ncbi:MAG TPA: MogA/MoaB family molybdenum cofactor biosynthesis protein [Candidatus Eremiobacteraceae bacterium]|nr:MogA/MoaB family molybdenum cofactor biosynthesis protein [Candidatus Eremiobacteraceae bacterium]
MATLMRVALIVLSDKAAVDERPDACLPEMKSGLPAKASVVSEEIMADDRAAIAARLARLCDDDIADVVLTSGGTGLSPRDVTPQATADIADYVVPGIGEAMRAASFAAVPRAMLSRAIAAVRGRTLVVNLPGSPKAVRETLAVVAGQLAHAVGLLRGEVGEHTG